MPCSRMRRPGRLRFPRSANHCLAASLLLLLSAVPASAQDTGTPSSDFHGRGVTISVVVHGSSGQPISSSAMVSLFRGTIFAGQAETTSGRAELVVYEIGDFTVTVQAAGYGNAQKDFYVNGAGRAEIDVYLHALSANPAGAPGRALLAPKAQKAVNEGLEAIAANRIGEAQKHASEAMRLAPGHPDVLYFQGVVYLKRREWSRAQEVLETATQLNPSHAGAFAALGMALCDQGKYEAAVTPLEKALQLNPSASWDTHWALARAYYQQAQYDKALETSQTALRLSNGKAPGIELLVAQSLTAVGRYEDAAGTLRDFLREHGDRDDAATARKWLEKLAANGKIRSN